MLDRLELLIGKDNIEKIKNSNITVLGLGGVGGYVVEALVRCGVSNITIVDFDKVEESNLNRQIIATRDKIGCSKTDLFKERILSINAEVNVKDVSLFVDESNIDSLFTERVDYFIDACDCINTKKLVIDRCLKNDVKFITSMGTGNRMDPSKLAIIDIRKTSNDPIAKILRKYVKDNKINKKIMTLCSSEVPIRKGKVVGSNSFVPASAGLLIASFVVRDIIKTL